MGCSKGTRGQWLGAFEVPVRVEMTSDILDSRDLGAPGY